MIDGPSLNCDREERRDSIEEKFVAEVKGSVFRNVLMNLLASLSKCIQSKADTLET